MKSYTELSYIFHNALATVEKDNFIFAVYPDDFPENPIQEWGCWGDARVILFGKFEYLGHEHTAAENRDGYPRLMRMKGYKVYPVYCYEHSSIAFSTSPHSLFDTGCVGYIYTTTEDYDCCVSMLNALTSFANGEVYSVALYEDGELTDSLSGVYDIDDALPDCEDLVEYLEWGRNIVVDDDNQ